MDFETTCFDRVVTIGNKTHRIEAPSLGLGLQILHILENMEDDEDVALLFHYLTKLNWRSPFAIADLRRLHSKNPILFKVHIKDVVMQGTELPDDIQKRVDDLNEDEIPAWRFLIAEYCRAFNANPHDVWENTPFTFFISMMREVQPLNARNKLDTMEAVGHGFSGGEAGKAWQKKGKSTAFKNSSNGEQKAEKKTETRSLKDARDFLAGKR